MSELGPDRWMPGEYAECQQETPWYRRATTPNSIGPSAGDVARVRRVIVQRHPVTGRNVEMLTFDRWPRLAFPSASFRKTQKPPFSIRSLTRLANREPHLAGVGAAAIVTAVVYGAGAVLNLFGSDQ